MVLKSEPFTLPVFKCSSGFRVIPNQSQYLLLSPPEKGTGLRPEPCQCGCREGQGMAGRPNLATWQIIEAA